MFFSNKQKKMSLFLITMLLAMLLPSAVFASIYGTTKTWSYSDYSAGTYVPKNGSVTPYYYKQSNSDFARTTVDFKLDSNNVTNILDYNNGGDNPGTAADNKNCYLTIDQTAKGNGELNALALRGNSVISNLPNPKVDLEDNYSVGINDETEVVALGVVQSGKAYNMSSYWDDYRIGGIEQGGKIETQFSMSYKPSYSLDYNNIVQSSKIQATVTYGKDRGKP